MFVFLSSVLYKTEDLSKIYSFSYEHANILLNKCRGVLGDRRGGVKN